MESFEPFKIKMVEPIVRTDRARREALLRDAAYNVFGLRSEDVTIDLLTDSGTSAMSQDQWAALMRGDEAYAGARSWFRFEAAVREVFGFAHVIPAHQGRAAERLLFGAFAPAPGSVVPNNNHFDTTKGNLEFLGVRALDLPGPDATDPAAAAPFKGDIDVAALDRTLSDAAPGQVPLVMLTVTNNSGGGQPVSMANIRATAETAHRYGIPLYLDACRFAENAYFIQQREPGYAHRPIRSIVAEMFSYADGCTMSAKKDALANMGGFVCTNDTDLAGRIRQLSIVTEGYHSYGGLSGRDLEAIAVGLEEVVDEEYLRYRIGQVQFLADRLIERGVPTLRPAGGHGVYLDARAFLPHVPALAYPAQTLVAELFAEGGIRASELGTVTFGVDGTTGEERPARWDLTRLAVPRRVYTRSHLAHVADVAAAVHARRADIRGLRIVEQPRLMRNFTARFEPL